MKSERTFICVEAFENPAPATFQYGTCKFADTRTKYSSESCAAPQLRINTNRTARAAEWRILGERSIASSFRIDSHPKQTEHFRMRTFSDWIVNEQSSEDQNVRGVSAAAPCAAS